MNDQEQIELAEIEKRIAEKQNSQLVASNTPAPKPLITSEQFNNEGEFMDAAVNAAARKAMTLKDVVNIGVTGAALKREGVIEELTDKKEQELKEDALAKVIASESLRIEQETAKVLEEGKKQIASLTNEINAAKAEKEKLEKEADKNKAYFNNHKGVLKYAGCKEPMSINYMQGMSVLGTIIMCIVKILFSPLILVGLFIEILMDIVGGVAEKVKHNAGRIVVTVALVIFILAVVIGAYFGIVTLFK